MADQSPTDENKNFHDVINAKFGECARNMRHFDPQYADNFMLYAQNLRVAMETVNPGHAAQSAAQMINLAFKTFLSAKHAPNTTVTDFPNVTGKIIREYIEHCRPEIASEMMSEIGSATAYLMDTDHSDYKNAHENNHPALVAEQQSIEQGKRLLPFNKNAGYKAPMLTIEQRFEMLADQLVMAQSKSGKQMVNGADIDMFRTLSKNFLNGFKHICMAKNINEQDLNKFITTAASLTCFGKRHNYQDVDSKILFPEGRFYKNLLDEVYDVLTTVTSTLSLDRTAIINNYQEVSNRIFLTNKKYYDSKGFSKPDQQEPPQIP